MFYNWESVVGFNIQSDPSHAEEKAQGLSGGSSKAQVSLNEASQGKLFVCAFDEMRSFYQTLFGITPREAHYNDERNRRACTFDLPSRHLVIIEDLTDDKTDLHDAQKLQELEFDVEGDEIIDALYEKLKCIQGCQVKQFPHFTKNHYYQLIVCDPENNTLIFRS